MTAAYSKLAMTGVNKEGGVGRTQRTSKSAWKSSASSLSPPTSVYDHNRSGGMKIPIGTLQSLSLRNKINSSSLTGPRSHSLQRIFDTILTWMSSWRRVSQSTLRTRQSRTSEAVSRLTISCLKTDSGATEGLFLKVVARKGRYKLQLVN